MTILSVGASAVSVITVTSYSVNDKVMMDPACELIKKERGLQFQTSAWPAGYFRPESNPRNRISRQISLSVQLSPRQLK
ncbi:MAG: hypothetical protein JRK26_07200 [Deltaproteobacteria bacterium]|nr:hypothetical protein [Deltaproteobacteria bacterium]